MERRQNNHPDLVALVLHASGDLRGVARLQLGWHLRHCSVCRNEVDGFRALRAELRQAAGQQAFASLPHWKRMEREMIGNITVGVAAARCIEGIGRKRVFFSRAVWACVAVTVLFIGFWVTRLIERRDVRPNSQQFAGTIVETTPGGIAVRTAGASLTILHPASAVVSLGRGPGLAASYIDQETGEVTITNVYGK